MPRLTSISKYWVSRCSGVFASRNVGTRLLPCSGICWTPVDEVRFGDPGRVQDRGRDVDQVTELGAHLAVPAEPDGPVHDRFLAGATPVGGDLLGPLIGGVHRPGPPDREVVEGLGSAELVDS